MSDVSERQSNSLQTASGGELRLFGFADMDTTQIVNGLERLFTTEGHRIVFWNDPDREFIEVVGTLNLDGVTVIHLDEMPALAVKIRVERTEPATKFLLYMPSLEPATEDDFLLDMRIYAGRFRADRASMLLTELGLGQHQTLREHLNKRLKFLGNKERVGRLAKLVTQQDDEVTLDRKMLALLTRADRAEPFAIFTTLYHDLANQTSGLEGTPATWEEIHKYGLAESLWAMAGQEFGYQEETPTLRNLLLRMLVTDFEHTLDNRSDGVLPEALRQHLLPKAFATNIVVCLNQWRDSAARGRSYDTLSKTVADDLKLPQLLRPLSAAALIDVVTFLDVEKQIAIELRDRILEDGPGLKASEIRAVVTRRQDAHWASLNQPSTAQAPRRAMHAVYEALEAAAEFAELLLAQSGGYAQSSVRKLYDSYTSSLFRLDQRYRHFCEAAALARAESWDLLKPLEEKMEADYGRGFLTPFALAWGACLEQDLLANWRIEGVDNQYEFYDRQVKPIAEGEGQKVFVIISDAFRYEVAHELTAELNGKYRFKAELTTQLGVLPSCTALGMAALLPHKTLAYGPNGDVLADGKSTSGSANRNRLLGAFDGIAVEADALLAMKREEGRAHVRNHRVVYIYHDTIDATGDKPATEDNTFQAVRRAIDEVGNLVRHLINSLNARQVIVTADHGFLFQQDPPDLTDKSRLDDKLAGTVRAKKRYLIGHRLPPPTNAYHGTTAITAKAESGVAGEMEFWLPKGTNRFHFVGGAKFFHGGAMPQEVVVPIVTVRELEGDAAEGTRTRPVAVHILGSRPRITTNRHRFQFIQTEAVTERNRPATLQIAVYDGDTLVTNVETITFDSASNDMNERTKSVSLVLKSQSYDKKKSYALVLRNAADNIEQQRTEVIIDLAFNNEF